MILAAVTSDGCSLIEFMEPGVKANAQYYRESSSELIMGAVIVALNIGSKLHLLMVAAQHCVVLDSSKHEVKSNTQKKSCGSRTFLMFQNIYIL